MQQRNYCTSTSDHSTQNDKTPNVVYVIDDDKALTDSLTWLLESVPLKVDCYNSGLSFLQAYQLNWRGCILLDVRLPFMNGLQLQETLVEMNNSMPIIILSGHGDIDMAISTFKRGAVDFITKPFNDLHLLETIQKALIQNQPQENKRQVTVNYNTLTAREHQVLQKMLAGKPNKIIAFELNISSKTVELHRSNLMKKMGAKSLASLVKMYCLMEEATLTFK